MFTREKWRAKSLALVEKLSKTTTTTSMIKRDITASYVETKPKRLIKTISTA